MSYKFVAVSSEMVCIYTYHLFIYTHIHIYTHTHYIIYISKISNMSEYERSRSAEV